MSFPCLISTKFIEMSLKGHPGHTLFSMLVWGVNKFCLKRSNFVQKWPNFEIFEKTYSPHLNGHSPHVASGKWVGQCWSICIVPSTCSHRSCYSTNFSYMNLATLQLQHYGWKKENKNDKLGSISSMCLRSAFIRANPKSAKKTVKSSSFLRFWDLGRKSCA